MHGNRVGLARLVLVVTAAILLAVLAGPVATASAAIITVNGDGDGAPANDGVCTLREAILNAVNNSQVFGLADCPAGDPAPTLDEIRFNIGGGGPRTIAPTSAFNFLGGGPLLLDATTQPLPDGLPLITVDGAGAGGADGFEIRGADVTVRGFAVVNFNRAGIFLQAGAQRAAIEGNHLGTDRTGLLDQGNAFGVRSAGAFNGRIGGTVAAQRNIISGNAVDGIRLDGLGNSFTIQGNYIGTNITGNAALPNDGDGIEFDNAGLENTIGGTAAGAANVISGNAVHGIFLHGELVDDDTAILGNRIGTNAAGTAVVPNGRNGLHLDGTRGVQIGGTAAGAGNQISGNAENGITLLNGTFGVDIQGNRIGTNAAGTAALPNQANGIRVIDSIGDVGGDAAGARNLISGNGLAGIKVETDASNIAISGNYIGTNASGTAAVPNQSHGVSYDGTNSLIGSSDPNGGNLISGNGGAGIAIGGGRLADIRNNRIGVDQTGAAPLPNGTVGIGLSGGSNRISIGSTTAGRGNIIAFNTGPGIVVSPGSNRIGIHQNRIFENGGLGIDLLNVVGPDPNDPGDGDDGANRGQNAPVIAAASSNGTLSVVGTLNTTPNTAGLRIDVFSVPACDPSGFGEGRDFLGTTTVASDAGGNAAWSLEGLPAVAAGTVVTATASNPEGLSFNTSELSACKAVVGPGSGAIVVDPQNIVTTEGGGQAAFTVRLASLPTANVTITLATTDPTEGTVSPAQLVFTPAHGTQPQLVTVTGIDDVIADGPIVYTIVTGAAVSADPAFSGTNPPDVTVTNQDNEGTLRLVVAGATIPEGNPPAAVSATVRVTLSHPAPDAVTVTLATADGTARAGNDYVALATTLTFQPGETGKDVAVTILPDSVLEDDETFTVNLSDASGAAIETGQATVTLRNDDIAPPVVPTPPVDPRTDPGGNDPNDGEVGKPKNDRGDQARETETRRQQRERTNRAGLDDYRTEGNVIAVDEVASPRTATIATRDGPQVVVLLCRDSCADPRVGDYLEAEGIKEHEALFYADSVTSRRPGGR